MRAHDRGVGIASFGRRRHGVVLAAALAAVAAAPASAEARHLHLLRPQAACPGAYAPALELTTARARRATLCVINQVRRQHGLRALRPMHSLRRAAAGFARDMVAHGFFGHVGPDGRDLVARLQRVGFIRRGIAWTAGENLAWGVGSVARPVEIVRGWMQSAPHRRNLLDRQFRLIGIGIDLGVPAAGAAGAAKAEGGATYVVDFGARGRL